MSTATKSEFEAKKAEQILRDALTASGLPQHVAVSIWCAADSWRRACVRAERERYAVAPGEVL